MPIYSDIRWFADLQKRRSRATVLIFVANPAEHQCLEALVQRLYTETTAKKQKVAVFFPIMPDSGDDAVTEVWTKFNASGKTPRWVILDKNGILAGTLEGIPDFQTVESNLRDLVN